MDLKFAFKASVLIENHSESNRPAAWWWDKFLKNVIPERCDNKFQTLDYDFQNYVLV